MSDLPEANATEAARKLAEFLAGLEDLRGKNGLVPEVSVYTFKSDDGGLRVSEIDCTYRHDNSIGGASWMRSDLEAAAVILAAENFLLFHGTPVQEVDTWESTLDESQEIEQALVYHTTGKLPKWEERPATHRYNKRNPEKPVRLPTTELES